MYEAMETVEASVDAVDAVGGLVDAVEAAWAGLMAIRDPFLDVSISPGRVRIKFLLFNGA